LRNSNNYGRYEKYGTRYPRIILPRPWDGITEVIMIYVKYMSPLKEEIR